LHASSFSSQFPTTQEMNERRRRRRKKV
jgi:hypothetical protein